MAVTTSVDICNSALIKIGEAMISALGDGTKASDLCNEIYAKRRDEVLQVFPWNFAVKELRLIAETHYNRAAITGITAAEPPVVSSTAHGFLDGDKIKITGVAGMTEVNGTVFWLEDKADDSYELVDEEGDDIDGSSFTAYTSGGYARKMPAIRYEYEYNLPSDCLRMLYLTDENGTVPDGSISYEFKVEKGKLLCNLEERNAFIKYTQQITDVTEYDDLFVEVLALRMAYEFAKPLAGSDTLGAEIFKLYQTKLSEAKQVHASENTDEAPEYKDTWIAARR